MPHLRYIQYARRSSEERTNRQLQSIEGQNGELGELARQMGLNVIEVLEESRTAKDPGRPVFDEMIRMLEKGKADAILCWHLDRLTRNEIDSGTLRWMLRKGLIQEIRTPHRVYRPGDSLLVTAVESALGEQFIVDLSHKVTRGMKQICEKGGIPFRVSQGYVNNPLTKKVEIDPDRFPLIQKAFQTVLQKSHSVSEIHRLMHEEWGYRKRGYANTSTHKLSLNALRALLSNPFYAGSFIWRGEAYSHDLPCAVTREEFDRVQEILRQRAHKQPSRKTFAFPYSGLILCASCGNRVTAEVSKGHVYYHCVNKLGICSKKGLREEEIENEIERLLKTIELAPAFEEVALEVLEDLKSEEATGQRSIAQSWQKTAAEIKKKKGALLELYLQGHLTEDEYAGKKLELSQREVNAGLEESQAEANCENDDKTLESIARYVVGTQSLFKAADVSTKRMIASHLATEYLLTPGKVEIVVDERLITVRTSFKKLTKNLKRFEPQKNRSQSWKAVLPPDEYAVWYSTLSQYRKYLRERKVAFEFLFPPADEGSINLISTEHEKEAA